MPTEAIPSSHADILSQPAIAHLASLGPEGEPQIHPVWFLWEDEQVKISTTTDRQKYRNLQRDPRAAVVILDLESPYRYLELRGEVVEVEEDPEKALIDRLAKLYLDADEYPNKQPDATRVVLKLEPRHAVTRG